MITSSTFRRSLTVVIAMAAMVMPCLAQVAVPAPTGTTVSFPEKLTFSGYVQGRYTDNLGDLSSPTGSRIPSAFDAKRAYASLRADINQHISATVMAALAQSPTSTFNLLEAYGEYRFNPTVSTRLGLSRIPFGYELPLSSASLITLERSQVTQVLLYDFEFDRGFFAYYNPINPKVSLALGLVNGSTNIVNNVKAPDQTTRKNFVGRLGYSLPWGKIGVSTYQGTDPDGVVMDRNGADLELAYGGFTLLSEALVARGVVADTATDGTTPIVFTSTNAKARGAYATLAYLCPITQLQPYVRLDTFDPHEDTDHNFSRATGGINYLMKNNSKVTLEYQTIDNQANLAQHRSFSTQYQVCF
jgi:hypothetical protein